jgi:hypothetical protein
MFKRRTWDEEFVPHGKRLYTQVKYDDRYLDIRNNDAKMPAEISLKTKKN